MDNLEKLKFLSKVVDARTFLEKNGFAVIDKKELTAVYAVFHAVEFYHRFHNENLPETINQIYLENKSIIDGLRK